MGHTERRKLDRMGGRDREEGQEGTTSHGPGIIYIWEVRTEAEDPGPTRTWSAGMGRRARYFETCWDDKGATRKGCE